MKNILEKIFTLALFAFIFGVYVYTLAPSVPSQADAGELITVAKILGISHPPGYPLHAILGHLFTYIPFNSVAWRVNLLSAVCHLLTLVCVYKIAVFITKKRAVGFATVSLLAFSGLFWLYSLITEVFSLNDLIAVMLIYLTLTGKNVFWLGLVFGLGLSNNQTIFLLLPALAYWLFVKNSKGIFCKVTRFSLGILIGLIPYGYIFIRAHDPDIPVAWTYPTDLISMVRLFLRSDYGTFVPSTGFDPSLATLADKIGQLRNFFNFSLDDLGIAVFVLSLGGVVIGMRNHLERKNTIFFLTLFFFAGIFFLSYANFPYASSLTAGMITERFYLLPQIIFVLPALLFLSFIHKKLVNWPVIRPLFFPSVILYLLASLLANYKTVSQRDNYLARDFGRNILKNVPSKSVIMLLGDTPTFSTLYVRYVENYRPDVDLITVNQFYNNNNFRYLSRRRPDLSFAMPISSTPSGVLDLNYGKADFYTFGMPDAGAIGYLAYPLGFLRKIVLAKDLPGFREWRKENESIINNYTLPDKSQLEKFTTYGDNVIFDYYVSMYVQIADYCLKNSDRECAVSYYHKSLEIEPRLLLINYLLGKALAESGKCQEAQEQFDYVFSLRKDAVFVVDDLLNLAKTCYKDDLKVNYYETMKKQLIGQKIPLQQVLY